MTRGLLADLAAIVGRRQVITDPDVLAARGIDHTGRYRGHATGLVRPGSAAEVADVLRVCRDTDTCVTVQGGRTSLVAGTVPGYDDVLLCTERLDVIGDVDRTERRVRAGAGVPLAALQAAARADGLIFGADLAARDTATVGGMAATNAGGLRTVRYGNMAEQILGLEVALPDGTLWRRHTQVRADNTGYDLPALFLGAEGTLGVITSLDLRLRPAPAHRIAAITGFTGLDAVADAARVLRDIDGIAALELIDARAVAIAADRLGVASPVDGQWLLLSELTGSHDPMPQLATALAEAGGCSEPVVGADPAAIRRLWRIREAVNEVLGVYGPPLKFDVALPLPELTRFDAQARELIGRHAPHAIPLLFGHIAEGNLHLNVLRCDNRAEAALYPAMMALIAESGGNVSSEHGVGSIKRPYLAMSREPADIAVMRAVKATFDPRGYLNPAVMFDPSPRDGSHQWTMS